ncbi:hypothetical protein A5643_01030 [Mycobacterium sp. 1274756.6]|nr:hypothetical protein A5643_01030 [Mycobacterium sp. 1274756.6]
MALAPLGVLESVTNTGFLPAMSMNALPDGLFSSAADVLDQLLSTNILGNAVGDINNFLAGGMTDIANGINTLGTYLGDGLQSVLGTFISNTGGIDILFDHIGTLLLAAPQILLQLLL